MKLTLFAVIEVIITMDLCTSQERQAFWKV